MYAIIKSGGKQYKVSEGDILNVDKLSKEPKETVEFAVVAVNNGDALLTADAIANAKVTAEVIVEGRDKKVIIYKKKKKKRQ